MIYMVRRKHCYGIYTFTDKQTGEIVYIGKDSHIDVKERIGAHYRPSAYDVQQFNRVLQNNPDRYEPKVYCHVDNFDELNQLEFDLINLYRPKFNFKHGGQGRYINRDFKYTVAKSGITLEGKQNYVIKTMYRKDLVQSVDYDYINDICSKLNEGVLTPDDVRQMKRRIIPSFESNLKRSKNNSTGFYRVRKMIDKTCKQGYLWVYEYYDENGKHKKFRRTNFFDLKKEVERRHLIWHIVDINKAIATVKSFVTI